MAKHFNPRATRARNTRAANERARAEDAQRKAWWAAHGKHVLIAVIAVIALIVAVLLIRHFVEESALPVEIRNTSAIQDNWLVIDTDNKLSKRYHHPASFDIPEGYEKGEFTKYNDGVARDFYLVATDPEAAVSLVYVDAAPELTAEEYIQRSIDMRENALNTGTTVTVGEKFTATIAGEEAHCLYLRFSTTQGDYGCLLCAFDAPRNVCVTATISGNYTTPENVQTADQLLTEAQTLLAGLTIVR